MVAYSAVLDNGRLALEAAHLAEGGDRQAVDLDAELEDLVRIMPLLCRRHDGSDSTAFSSILRLAHQSDHDKAHEGEDDRRRQDEERRRGEPAARCAPLSAADCLQSTNERCDPGHRPENDGEAGCVAE